MRIIFRADASVQMGAGHVMRCATLAHLLKKNGAQVSFVGRELQGNLFEFIENAGYEVVRLPRPDASLERVGNMRSQHVAGSDWRTDVEQTKRALARRYGTSSWADWLVVDHYALEKTWESAMRSHVDHIMVIDDLADREHDCDLLLDQNLYCGMDARYAALVPADAQQLLGPKYALLRPEFSKLRKVLRKRDGTIRRVLVSFGGMDAQNMTVRAMDALRQLSCEQIRIDVVVGSQNPNLAIIRDRCATMSQANLLVQAENMAELIQNADLAIGAGGTSTWERCALGLPSVVVTVVEHQDAIAEAVANKGAALWLGNIESASREKLGATIGQLISQPEALVRMSEFAAELVDGNGAATVAEIIATWH